jgi:hypothetical protein
MAFNLDSYETVAERLNRAHSDHPDLRIITDLIAVERDDNHRPIQYIVRAQAWLGDVLKAQDYAEEMVGSSNVNRTSALENCTTSAIGRALSAMNYQGSINGKPSRVTKEEMQKVERTEQALKAPVYTPEQISDAQLAIEQVAAITSVEELKLLYTGAQEAGLLAVPVNGKTLQQVISTHKKSLEAKNV